MAAIQAVRKEPDALRTAGEVCIELGITKWQLRAWRERFRKEIRPISRNGRFYFKKQDIDAIAFVASASAEGVTLDDIQQALKEQKHMDFVSSDDSAADKSRGDEEALSSLDSAKSKDVPVDKDILSNQIDMFSAGSGSETKNEEVETKASASESQNDQQVQQDQANRTSSNAASAGSFSDIFTISKVGVPAVPVTAPQPPSNASEANETKEAVAQGAVPETQPATKPPASAATPDVATDSVTSKVTPIEKIDQLRKDADERVVTQSESVVREHIAASLEAIQAVPEAIEEAKHYVDSHSALLHAELKAIESKLDQVIADAREVAASLGLGESELSEEEPKSGSGSHGDTPKKK